MAVDAGAVGRGEGAAEETQCIQVRACACAIDDGPGVDIRVITRRGEASVVVLIGSRGPRGIRRASLGDIGSVAGAASHQGDGEQRRAFPFQCLHKIIRLNRILPPQ